MLLGQAGKRAQREDRRDRLAGPFDDPRLEPGDCRADDDPRGRLLGWREG